MVQVLNPFNIDKVKAVQKWQQILDNFKVPTSLHETLSLYCESHALQELSSYTPLSMPNNLGMPSQPQQDSLLPEALKIFSQLNLTDKNVQIVSSPSFQYLDDTNQSVHQSHVLTHEVEASWNHDSIKYPDEIRHQLINEMAHNINQQLENHNTIVIYLLVTNIRATAESTMAPKIILTSRYSLFDQINPTTETTEETKPVYLTQATNSQLLAELTKRLN